MFVLAIADERDHVRLTNEDEAVVFLLAGRKAFMRFKAVSSLWALTSFSAIVWSPIFCACCTSGCSAVDGRDLLLPIREGKTAVVVLAGLGAMSSLLPVSAFSTFVAARFGRSCCPPCWFDRSTRHTRVVSTILLVSALVKALVYGTPKRKCAYQRRIQVTPDFDLAHLAAGDHGQVGTPKKARPTAVMGQVLVGSVAATAN